MLSGRKNYLQLLSMKFTKHFYHIVHASTSLNTGLGSSSYTCLPKPKDSLRNKMTVIEVEYYNSIHREMS